MQEEKSFPPVLYVHLQKLLETKKKGKELERQDDATVSRTPRSGVLDKKKGGAGN